MGLSCWLRLFRPLVSRGRVCPSGCSCGGYAAGALLGRLCRLGLSRVRGLSLAWARLTGRVLLRRLCRRCAFGSAVPLGLGLVLSLRLTLARLSCRMQLRRLCRRCAFGLAVPLGLGLVLSLRLALARLSCRVPFGRSSRLRAVSAVGGRFRGIAALTAWQECTTRRFPSYTCGAWAPRTQDMLLAQI